MTNNPQPRRTSAAPAVPRRGRRLAWLSVLLLVTVPALAGRGGAPEPFLGATLTTAGLDVPPEMAAEVAAVVLDLPVMATVSGIQLHTPTAQPVIVGFHEASFDDALDFEPVGTLVTNDNTTKFSGGLEDLSGIEYVVQASRGRGHSATSAVDVVMEPGIAVLSPVDGLVTVVEDYELYGDYPDTRIEIQPDAAPHLRVVLIHVRDVSVEPGRRVVAGVTQLAGEANRFGFESQIDRYASRPGLGHVHIEVKPPGGQRAD